jgi:hypothetical protein
LTEEIRAKYQFKPMIDVAMGVLQDLLALPASSWPTFEEERRELHERARELLADYRTLSNEPSAPTNHYPRSER